MRKEKVYNSKSPDEIKPAKSPYNAEFVERIKQSKKEVEAGRFIILDPSKSLWENLNDHIRPDNS